MPVPKPVLEPPFRIVRLSHVELGVTDLDASRAFYEGTLGLQVSDEETERVFLRGLEERGHHCLVLHHSSVPEVRYLAYKLYAEEDMERAYAWFERQGHKVQWVGRPFQGRTLRTHDCFGAPIEFYCRMEQLAPIHQDYRRYHGVRPLRIDHANCFVPNVDRAVKFYGQMGFRVTEYTEDEATGRLWAAWMHRKGGVHDVAFTNGTGPRLHHIALWVPTPLAIIDLLDLMSTTGYLAHIERGPGRHGISNAFFVYVRDPDGHRVELYCSDYLTADPDLEPIKWDLKDPQRQTLWGAPAPKSWFEQGSVFKGVAPERSDMKASPIVAP